MKHDYFVGDERAVVADDELPRLPLHVIEANWVMLARHYLHVVVESGCYYADAVDWKPPLEQR